MADRVFNLEVVTPRREVIKADSTDVILPGITGQLEAYPLHRPLLTALKPGLLACQLGDGKRSFYISGGYAEVLSDRIVVLADDCEEIKAIDLEEARARAADANKALDERRMLPPDERAPFQTAADKANTRLRLVEAAAHSDH